MLIKKINVKNFKSFKSQEIKGFAPINMIYGYNNSGKSNFLKLVEMIFRRKVAESQTSKVLDTEETHTETSLGNWWEGTIEDEPYIFRNGDRNTPIEFSVVVGIKKDIIKDTLSSFKDLKAAYFNDTHLNEQEEKVEGLQEKYNEEGTDELKNEVKKNRERLEALSEANSEEDGNLEIEFTGKIISRGKYDAEMRLDTVKIFDQYIFREEEQARKFFEEVDDNSELHDEAYNEFVAFMSLLDDAVLFLDNDRYFTSEKEDRNKNGISPKTFKNWLYNLYMDPYSFQEYNDILEEIRKFDPSSGGDGTIKSMEKNSPLESLEVDFGRTETNELLLMLSNEINSVDRLPLESYGTGIQQILYILARIAEFSPKILLLEELELNLSPKYQEDLVQHILLKLIQKSDKDLTQLFFTSHSPILCIHTDYQIHQVTIDENGVSSFYKADKDKISDFYPKEVIQKIIEQHK